MLEDYQLMQSSESACNGTEVQTRCGKLLGQSRPVLLILVPPVEVERRLERI